MGFFPSFWNSGLCNPVTTTMETYVKWSGRYSRLNDSCIVSWWIIYEPLCSGSHQQVTGESTAVLKTITDISNSLMDRQQRKTCDRSLNKGPSMKNKKGTRNNATMAFLFVPEHQFELLCLMRFNLLSVCISLQVDWLCGWFFGWWWWSQAGCQHAPSCVCVTPRPWRSAASPRTSP